MQKENTPIEQQKTNLKKTIKNIFYYAFVGLFLLILAVSAFMPAKLIQVTGVGWYRVVSDSMEDIIMVNDYIIATKTDVDQLEDGDIIVFETYIKYNGRTIYTMVTHHFSHIDAEGNVYTYPHSRIDMDDSNPLKFDTWYDPEGNVYYPQTENILGQHSFTIHSAPVVNFIIFLFTNPIGWAVIIINGGIIAAIIYLVKEEKRRKKALEDEVRREINDMGDTPQ